jgi:hypothetical protein
MNHSPVGYWLSLSNGKQKKERKKERKKEKVGSVAMISCYVIE